MIKDVKKIVLAYSGGLDTSVILKWLQDQYDCEVVHLLQTWDRKKRLNQQELKRSQQGYKRFS